MGIILSLLTFVFVISVLVAVHELGHLIIARKNGVFVEAFSIGCGPVLTEKLDKYGTKWRVSLLPIGGYVKMLGDADITSVREIIPDNVSEEEMEMMSIHRKKPWQKLLVAVGGPLANLIFAVVVLTGLSMIVGIPTYLNVIHTTSESSIAYKSGLRNGDKIISINNQSIEKFSEIKDIIRKGEDLNIKAERSGKVEKIHIKMKDDEGNCIKTIGITPTVLKYEKSTFVNAIWTSCVITYTIAVENISAICQIIVAKRSTKDVGGVISIFKMAEESAEKGISSLIWMMAFLSIILGAVNLLPIPVLDGGTILISSIEWIIGRPLNEKFVNAIFFIGLTAVALLMLLGIWNDLAKLKFIKWMFVK
ncbi:MAG: RIP metalloprotease RseP [Holosporales bacterium]|jgi:regulator of sigma E protease|nr:RIP metalloprotease RseP [Holosporales bacterium]